MILVNEAPVYATDLNLTENSRHIHRLDSPTVAQRKIEAQHDEGPRPSTVTSLFTGKRKFTVHRCTVTATTMEVAILPCSSYSNIYDLNHCVKSEPWQLPWQHDGAEPLLTENENVHRLWQRHGGSHLVHRCMATTILPFPIPT